MSQLLSNTDVGSSPRAALLVALVLLAITVPLARRVARRDGEERLRWLIPVALGLHFLGSIAQLVVVNHVYHGVADFHLYTGQGAALAANFRAGHLTLGGIGATGDGFVSIVTGVVFTIVGSNVLAAFFVFSWLALLGTIAFYRAFRIAVPEGAHMRYAVLIFLLPSLLYWPSAVGKESLMAVGLGVAAYGAARLLTHRRGGVVLLAAGSAWAAVIRPHEALLFFGAVAVAFVLRGVRRKTVLAPLRIAGGIVLLAGAGAALVFATKSFLHVQNLSVSGVSQALNATHARAATASVTGTGSSHISWSANPLMFPKDVYTVLFDPLLIRAHGVTQLLAAVENTVVIGVILFSLSRLSNLPRLLIRAPYVTMAALYSAGFLYLFASLGNIGLIDRERTLLFPLLLVLVCVPRRLARARARSPRADRLPALAAVASPGAVDLLRT